MSNLFLQLDQIFTTRDPQPDEYRNASDGLIYCRECHTPRQATILPKGAGSPVHPFIRCKCQLEKQQREDEERKDREFQAEIARMRASGLQDKTLRGYTFANDLGYNPEIGKARQYAEHFPEMERDGKGLLLWGGVGTGKTFIAACIANALLDRRVPVLMTNFSRILNKLTGMFSDDRNVFLDSFQNYRLLIIDDLGIERNSEYAVEQVFGVIDRRYQSGMPLIVTTNLTLDELKNPADLAHQRIYDRVLERCIPLKVNNRSIWQENAVRNIAEVKSAFSTGSDSTLY